MWPCALRFDPTVRDPFALHMLMMEQVCRDADEFDILLHFHTDYWSFFAIRPPAHAIPHHPARKARSARTHLALRRCFTDVPLVSISNAQRRPLPHTKFISTVHHGLPENLLTPRPVKPSYLAFLGRICPEKRPDLAIRIARRSGIPLKIAAKVDQVDRQYFHDVIRPLIDGRHVELIGEISDARKVGFSSGGAIGLLLPIDWPETIRSRNDRGALARGTPVIAFDRGSVVPEIIEHGVTGFIVRDELQAAAAVPNLASLVARSAIRQQFVQRFTARAAWRTDYLALYRSLGRSARGPSCVPCRDNTRCQPCHAARRPHVR